MKHLEYNLQKQVCKWLNLQHSKLLYVSDMAGINIGGMYGSLNAAVQKPNFKKLDITILEPSGIYHGLFIELKTETPFTKKGTLKKNDHLYSQAETMEQLRAKGYCCHFAWTLEQVQEIVNNYLNSAQSDA
jgi:hypothetical protein